ncbi:SEC63 [Cordylochernes scorpioides]|uniref:SEC63 n=1 Tax=Cordylochernes scorpioides TaxID=51811 RepID=A0ABY6KH64_9ARAC|nr:SEC63 [Cordylochernes scorpioides]
MATGDATMFMKIAKAHAALTDDESRKNWETYGNPDGPGATSFGIALPSWIIEKENAVWVLGVYALIFMVFLPVAVGVWWYRSVKFGGDQVLLATSQIYFAFLHKTPYMVLKRVLMVLAASYEFDKAHNSKIVERPSDNIEIPQLMKELPNLGEKNRENPLGCSYSIKARALLHAHLTRLKLPPNTLEEDEVEALMCDAADKMYVLKKCPYLLQDFVQRASQMITLALNGRLARMPNLETMENAMKLCPMIVQALWDNKSPLLQLPNITEDLLRHFTNRKRNIRSLKHLAMMKSSDRRAMLRSLSDSQYSDVMTVLANMPLIELDVRSEVLDDEDSGTITAGAIVTVTVTLVRKTLSTLFDKSDDKALDNTEEPAAAEEAEQQLANGGGEHSPNQARKPKVWEKAPKKKKGKPKKKAGGGGGGHKPAQQAAKKQPQPANNVAASAATAAAKKPSEAPADAPSQQNKENPPAKEKEEASEESSSGSEQSEAEEDDWEELHQQVGRKEKVLETKSKISHSVHCPHFPEDKQEYWWIYIADHKRKLLMTAPYLITNLVDQEEVHFYY